MIRQKLIIPSVIFLDMKKSLLNSIQIVIITIKAERIYMIVQKKARQNLKFV